MCGIDLGRHPSHFSVSTGSGDISGEVYQAGRDIFLGGHSQELVAEYEPKWSWKSPLTMSVLTWISVVLGLFSILAGWQGFTSSFSEIQAGAGGGPRSINWLIVFLTLFILFVISVWLRRVTKRRTQHFSPWSFLPSITGWGGRIGLAKLQGECPKCGGDLRFYNKPVEWITDVQSGKIKVTRRAAAGECSRNPDHWWTVDRSDGD